MSNDQDRLLTLLSERAMSVKDIAAELGIIKQAAQRRVKRLHSKQLVRVCGWRRTPEGVSGKFTALYAPATGMPDAPRPELRPKPRSNPEYEEARCQRRRLANAQKRLVGKLAEQGPWAQLRQDFTKRS